MTQLGTGYQVALDVFEGPLDLLLHLVKKHELDIMDIPISFVTEKYLEYLDLMQEMHLDIAGEYLLMAATLAHIKSRELLPTQDPTQLDADDPADEADPREELIRRLLQYQKYKEAAQMLGTRPVVGRNVWTRGAQREDVLAENVDLTTQAPLAEIPVARLLVALDGVLRRAKINLAHSVTVDRLSVSERINELVDRLELEGSFSFSSCFSFLDGSVDIGPGQAKHQVVVTFLALLEMAKLRLILLSQAETADQAEFPDIFIARSSDDVRARAEAVVGETDYS